jgi:ATP-dependent DNA helicase RecQ
MSEDILSSIGLTPADAPSLSAPERSKLIAFLLRWQHHGAVHRCLQQLLVTHSHLVSTYDSLARVYLAQDHPQRALEMMRRRHAIRISNSSQVLEARALLDAGFQAAAEKTGQTLVTEHPDLLLTWSLQAEIKLAAGDLDEAEAAWRQREALRPGLASTAQGIATVWQARSDPQKALLWARTALSRTQRDERPPAATLLRLLESLYRETGQAAQADDTASQLQRLEQQELDELCRILAPAPPLPEPEPEPVPASFPDLAVESRPLTPAPEARSAKALEPVVFDYSSEVIAGAVSLSTTEQSRLEQILQSHFGHDTFRSGQADTIATILRGESALAVMPTGAGKSLCYQLASQMLPDTTLVISPLIALMKDQLDRLPDAVSSRATLLNSTVDGHELEARLQRATAGQYKLLYAAPERLRQFPFLHALKRAAVSLLVVDEAHCVSLWGHDFRPDYLFIARAWHELGEPPILGLTATATPRVRDDIQASFGKMRLVATDIHRPNLRLEAQRHTSDQEKRQALLSLCKSLEGSGIVYVPSRAKAESLATMLCKAGLSAIHYHARIQDRAATQDRFMGDQVRIVVATIAFGMGVDKSDVRFVIHYSPPKALESYYQEAGRAGRDGLLARCILFHTPSDKGNLTRWNNLSALKIDFLRRAYSAIEARLGSEKVGLVTAGDLERDLATNETQVRVAIHFLESAGLLWRGFDLPRTATLILHRSAESHDSGSDQSDGSDFARFVKCARLRPGQRVSRDLVTICHEVGIDPRTVESLLLQWHASGLLRYRGIGRDILLALPEPPPDSHQRVTAMLADYHAGKDGRAGEMMAYANTSRCRHGYISAYFGGRPIDHCTACDNCLGLVARRTPPRRAQPRRSRSRKSVQDLSRQAASSHSAQIPVNYDEILFQSLRTWRLDTARELDIPPFVVFHDAVLKRIAASRPASHEELDAIRGIGPRKLEQYAQAVLAIVAEHEANLTAGSRNAQA